VNVLSVSISIFIFIFEGNVDDSILSLIGSLIGRLAEDEKSGYPPPWGFSTGYEEEAEVEEEVVAERGGKSIRGSMPRIWKLFGIKI
jgi:hypothetical protein